MLLRFGIEPYPLSGEYITSNNPKSFFHGVGNRKKILIIGMSESPHLHSWIGGIAESGIVSEIWLFPSDFPVRKYQNSKIKIRQFPYFISGYLANVTFRFLDIVTSRLWRSYFLYREIKRLKPTHIHFHETQHGAYLYNSIARHPKNRFTGRLILSTWGSDLIVYGKIKSHAARIKQTMTWVDLLTSERVEDLEIATDNGFEGEFLAPIYITVGNRNHDLNLEKTSKRLLVLIKGYQDNHGRGLNALKSLELLSSQMDLNKFKFRIFSASESVELQAELLRHKIDVEVLPRMPKSELMEYFKEARVYLGLAISDGLSTSMVEAMSYGAFPIQSQNSAAPKFLIDGLTGGVVDPWNIQEIADIFKKALTDDVLVDRAAISNTQILADKYCWEIGLSKMAKVYD
jgi:glycosyltransferase involved in cell wall biosynthesis